MAEKTYRINEVFYSLQGEGMRAGTANVFVRFTGCNMKCRIEPGELSPGGFDCDTEFASGRSLTAKELIEWVMSTDPHECGWVIFTGGEPGLQLDASLVEQFHLAGYKCAVETNGSIDLTGLGLDWTCVSPKVAEHAVRQLYADEVKYVRAHGQGIPKPACLATNKLLSPAFNGLDIDRASLNWCIDLVRENPEWRLSVQLHKSWTIR